MKKTIIREKIEAVFPVLADCSGLLDVYASLRRKFYPQVIIVLYHLITPDFSKQYLGKVVPPQDFSAQLEELGREYEIISLEYLAEMIGDRKKLPRKAAVITIDDGYKDNYRYAYPILKRYGIPATMFIATGHIGTQRLFWSNLVKYALQYTSNVKIDLSELGSFKLDSAEDESRSRTLILEKLKRLPYNERDSLVDEILHKLKVDVPEGIGTNSILTWDEVREMDNDGVRFGAHTVNHAILTSLPLEEAKWEIKQSKTDMELQLGHSITTFAYPNGGYRDFNEAIIRLVRDCGFSCAVTTIPQWISNKTDIYKLGRAGITDNQHQFKVLISGLYGDLGIDKIKS